MSSAPTNKKSRSKPKGQQRKERHALINLSIKEAFFSPILDAEGEPTGGVRLAAKDGAPLQPYAAAIGQAYERPKGPKTLVRMPIELAEGMPAHHDVNARLTQYDHVFAVDTNTVTIGEQRLSVTAWVHVEDMKLPAKGTVGPWSFRALHQQATPTVRASSWATP